MIDWLIDWCLVLMSMWHLLINHRFLVNKISLTTPLSIELPRSSQEIYTCWRYRLFLFPRFVYWILELFRQCGIFFSFSFFFSFLRSKILSNVWNIYRLKKSKTNKQANKLVVKLIIIWNKILSFNNGLYDNVSL